MPQLRSQLSYLKQRMRKEHKAFLETNVPSTWPLYARMRFLKPYLITGDSTTASTIFPEENLEIDIEEDEEPVNVPQYQEDPASPPSSFPIDISHCYDSMANEKSNQPCDRSQMMGNFIAMHMRLLSPEHGLQAAIAILTTLSDFMKYRISN